MIALLTSPSLNSRAKDLQILALAALKTVH